MKGIITKTMEAVSFLRGHRRRLVTEFPRRRLIEYSDGRKIIECLGVGSRITEYSDGRFVIECRENGMVTIYPDGKIVTAFFGDYVPIRKATEYPDGMEVLEYANGESVVKYPDGRELTGEIIGHSEDEEAAGCCGSRKIVEHPVNRVEGKRITMKTLVTISLFLLRHIPAMYKHVHGPMYKPARGLVTKYSDGRKVKEFLSGWKEIKYPDGREMIVYQREHPSYQGGRYSDIVVEIRFGCIDRHKRSDGKEVVTYKETIISSIGEKATKYREATRHLDKKVTPPLEWREKEVIEDIGICGTRITKCSDEDGTVKETARSFDCREIEYPSGWKITKYQNDSMVIEQPHGLRLTVRSNGETVAETSNGKKVTIYPDGRKATEYSDGEKVIELPDGREVIQYPDGRKITNFPGGRNTTEYPDGRIVKGKTAKHSDGRKITKYSDGKKVTEFHGNSRKITVTEYSDGKKVTEFPDGRKEINFPDGRSEIDDSNVKEIIF